MFIQTSKVVFAACIAVLSCTASVVVATKQSDEHPVPHTMVRGLVYCNPGGRCTENTNCGTGICRYGRILCPDDVFKFTVCHVPPGKPDKFVTLVLPKESVKQHLDGVPGSKVPKGDAALLGSCADSCPLLLAEVGCGAESECYDGEHACVPAPKKFVNAGGHGPLKCATRKGKTHSITRDAKIGGDLQGIPERVFQSYRAGEEFTYQFDHHNYEHGHEYVVTMGFAETRLPYCETGRRVMDVTVNGQAFATNLDVFFESGGCNTAHVVKGTFVANKKGFLMKWTGRTNEAMFSTVSIEAVENPRNRRLTGACAVSIP